MATIIGISGVSGSGKTTLTQALSNLLEATAIYWDEYYEISDSPEDYVAWYKAGKPDGLAAWKYPRLAATLGGRGTLRLISMKTICFHTINNENC
ncbi:MAG: hypothetical protein H6618_06810 [Deltaproteobacteria bacterium]|nr:hypothetical protein [Deltaproteobacteria bacterium]